MKRKQYREDSPNTSKKKLAIKISLLLLLSLLLSLTAYGAYLAKKAEHAANKAYEPIPDRAPSVWRGEDEVEPENHNISILLMGLDDGEGRKGDASLTDALIVATLNV